MFSISDYSTQQLSDRSDKQQDYQQQQQQSVSQQKQQKLGLMDDQSVVGSKDHSSPSDFSLKLVSYELNPQQSSSTEHYKLEIQAATFLAEGALSYHIIVLNHYDLF